MSARRVPNLRFPGPWLAAAVAVGLWVAAWWCHPVHPGDRFDPQFTPTLSWPAIPPFTLPGVPPPAFYDLQVLLWGIETSVAGADPYVAAPPPGTPYWFNYPRGWLQFGLLGAKLEWLRVAGLGILGGFLLLAMLALRPLRTPAALWFIAMLLSAPLLEGISHVNNDLLLFILLALAGECWASGVRGWRWVGVALTAVGAWLKLFPALALISFLEARRRTLAGLAVAGVALLVFFAFHLEEIRQVSARTPRPHVIAVGSQVLSSRLLDGVARSPSWSARLAAVGGLEPWQRVLPVVSWLVLAVMIGIAVRRAWRAAAGEPGPVSRPQVHFRLGASAFLACFAIGHNYMHREVFLLLAGGWLLAEARRRWVAWLMVPMAWLGGFPTGAPFLVSQVLSWIVVGGLAYWLAWDLAPVCRRVGAGARA